MKINYKIHCLVSIILIILFIICCVLTYFDTDNSVQAEYSKIGAPNNRFFEIGSIENSVWDMEKYDGRIFCGGGDFDTNAGPVAIWNYKIKEKKWATDGFLPEEQISRFKFINNKFLALGIDAREGWELGNYYIYDNGWQQQRTIPNGVHVFDMTEFNGLLFAGIGVSEYYCSPIVCSKDGGKNFSNVEIEKFGQPLEMSSDYVYRAYDFFIQGNNLYALICNNKSYDIYVYQKGKFVCLNYNFESVLRDNCFYSIINAKESFKNKTFFTTGFLYESANMSDFSLIFPKDTDNVLDIYLDNNVLYILCSKKVYEKEYITSVWLNRTGEKSDFVKMFEFQYGAQPMSMVRNRGDFYIGMGGRDYNEKNGDVLLVERAAYMNKALLILTSIILCLFILHLIFRIVILILKLIKTRLNR